MNLPKPRSIQSFRWRIALWGISCLIGCLIFWLLFPVISYILSTEAGTSLGDGPGALGATLPSTSEQKEAQEKEKEYYPNLIRRNLKEHQREFKQFAMQLLAAAGQNKPAHFTSEHLAILKKMQIKEAAAVKKAGHWQVEFFIDPKRNDLGVKEEDLADRDVLYIYSDVEPTGLADDKWYCLPLKNHWYYLVRGKSSNLPGG